MQSDASQFVSGAATLGGLIVACQVYLAGKFNFPGPVRLIKRGLTHCQATVRVLAEIGSEIPAEFKSRYRAAFDSVKGEW